MYKLAAVVVAIAALAIMPFAAGAQVESPAGSASFGNITIHNNGNTASLSVRYRCYSGSEVWVSAKQSKTGKTDPRLTRDGSSEVANAWLQSHRNPINCDGRFHTATFTIDKVEYGFGKLKQGLAWVQFCVTEDMDLTLSESAWVTVV
jgi:hypothetical protein